MKNGAAEWEYIHGFGYLFLCLPLRINEDMVYCQGESGCVPGIPGKTRQVRKKGNKGVKQHGKQ